MSAKWYAKQPYAGFSEIREEGTNRLIFALAHPSTKCGDAEPTAEEKYQWLNLIAAAPDHALVARFLASKKMRWEVFAGSALGDGSQGELCFDGMRHSTHLDEFGVPKLTDHLRAALRKADGEGAA